MQYDKVVQNFLRHLVNTLILSVFFVVIASIGLWGAREWFLWRGIESFKIAIHEARRLNAPSGSSCADEFGVENLSEEGLIQQIRFTDDRRFNLELLCPGFSDLPLVTQPKVLSSFISKAPGSSGIVVSSTSAQYITLRVFGPIVDKMPEELVPVLGWIAKSAVIGWDGGQIVEKTVDEVAVTSLGPVAECSGYGYTCCDAVAEIGEGLSIQNIKSCAGGCFEKCIRRPVVVSLRTDPSVDWETAQVEVNSGENVTFVWGLEDDAQSGPWKITLDLGDGSQETSDILEGFVEHAYTCSEPECLYSASITVLNAKGISSAETNVSKLQILVKNQ